MTANPLDADYEAAGFRGHLTPGSTPALLVVDAAKAYLDPESPLYAGVEDALASILRLVDSAHASHVPVVFTRVEYAPGGADGGVFFRKVPALQCFVRGNPLGDFAAGIEPTADDIVLVKQYASAFFGTSLSPTLTALGVDTLVIAGFSTSGCVRASALDACQHGFIPMVVRDAVGDRAPEPHEANLFDLQAKYAEVVSERDALKVLRR